VHDFNKLERRGLAAVFVATTAFIDGAKAQAKALGIEPQAVYVPHPIQDRTEEEIRAIARNALAEIVGAVSG